MSKRQFRKLLLADRMKKLSSTLRETDMNPEAHTSAQFGWYEAGLPLAERRRRGHFSTPHTLVDAILDACGYAAGADLCNIRLLDPACGSGNFLTRAVLRLCQAMQDRKYTQEQVVELIQRNIWGLDPDPVACFLAEMQVRFTVEQALNTRLTSAHFHIHQADSLALPWQPCVDLLVANPPYLAAKNMDLSHYLQARKRGQVDSYLLFLDLALRAVRPGGWIGLVLPDPVLARVNAAPERERLLHECTLHATWHLSGVFSAEVGAVVLICQKTPPLRLHQVAWIRARWQDGQMPNQSHRTPEPAQHIPQALLAAQPGSSLRYLLSTEQGQRVEWLRRASEESQTRCTVPETLALLPLEQLVSIKRGEELGRASPLIESLTSSEDGYPLLRGGLDISPYTQPQARWRIARAAIHKPLERYVKPKLLVVKSTERLQAALDTRGHVVLQTLYLLHLQIQDESLDAAYFLLALLNSRLLRAYVYHLHTAYKLVQPQIEQAVLARLPVPWGPRAAWQEISQRARELEKICSTTSPVVKWDEHLTSLYEEQEQAIGALYAIAIAETSKNKGVQPYVRDSSNTSTGC